MPVKVKRELNPAVLTTQEAASYICSSKSELDMARVTGNLSGRVPPKFFRIGRSVRYRIADLDAWLEEQPSYRTVAESLVH